jgi:hypothetical protein
MPMPLSPSLRVLLVIFIALLPDTLVAHPIITTWPIAAEKPIPTVEPEPTRRLKTNPSHIPQESQEFSPHLDQPADGSQTAEQSAPWQTLKDQSPEPLLLLLFSLALLLLWRHYRKK